MPLSPKFTVVLPPQHIQIPSGITARLATGDAKAFDWLYTTFSGKLYHHSLLITGSEVLSEDIVQEVFSKLWQKRNQVAGVKDINAYLHTITRNHINSHWRKQTVEKKYLEDQKHLLSGSCHAASNTNELSDIVSQAVERLPRQQKIVYILKREENWKKTRIAEALNISPETVKAHMYQALRSIKTFVKQKL